MTQAQPHEILSPGQGVLQQGEEALQQGEEVLQQGQEALPQGREVLQQGEEVLQQGEEALQQGEEVLQQGEEALPSIPEDLSRTTHIVLVRHGLPMTGVAADPPLSPLGQQQACQAGDWLRWESPVAVISSPYLRALETAQAIGLAAGLPVEIDEDLREWGEPVTSYITPELLGDSPRGRAFAEGRFAEFIPEHDREGLTRRMTAVVAKAGERWPGRTVVLVSHGGAINNLLAHVIGLAQPFFFNPGYTSLCRLQMLPSGRMVPTSINETSHLVAARNTATPILLGQGAA